MVSVTVGVEGGVMLDSRFLILDSRFGARSNLHSRISNLESRILKEALLNHHMHTNIPIHQLRNAQIGGYAGQRIGVAPLQALLLHQEVDHLLYRDLRGPGEIFVHTHDDKVRGRFRPRPLETVSFPDEELQPAV